MTVIAGKAVSVFQSLINADVKTSFLLQVLDRKVWLKYNENMIGRTHRTGEEHMDDITSHNT